MEFPTWKIVELKTYVGDDKQLRKNIISSCNMYCGKYYINMPETIKKYFKKDKKKDIFVLVKDTTSIGINKLFSIMGYCIVSYKKDCDKYLINVDRNLKSIGYRYVNQKNAREILKDRFQKTCSHLNVAHLNVICALTPEKIPLLPEYKDKHIIKYFNEWRKYKKTRSYYQLEERKNKIQGVGTYFLKSILEILKKKNMDIVKLSSLDLNCNDTRNRFYMRQGFNYSLNYYNHRIKFNQYTNMILDLNNASLKA